MGLTIEIRGTYHFSGIFVPRIKILLTIIRASSTKAFKSSIDCLPLENCRLDKSFLEKEIKSYLLKNAMEI